MIKASTNRWFDLKKFDSEEKQVRNPFIRITASGLIIFNKSFINALKKEHDSENVFYCFYYSNYNKAIVLKSSSYKEDKRYRKAIYAQQCSKSFFNFFKLDPDKISGKYLMVENEIPNLGKCWVCYLDTNKIKENDDEKTIKKLDSKGHKKTRIVKENS